MRSFRCGSGDVNKLFLVVLRVVIVDGCGFYMSMKTTTTITTTKRPPKMAQIILTLESIAIYKIFVNGYTINLDSRDVPRGENLPILTKI